MKNLFIIFTLFLFSNFSAQIEDDTKLIQNQINNLPKDVVLDGDGKTFYVTSIWLKSNITLKNFNFVSIPTPYPDVSVLCIGNDLKTNPFNTTKEAVTAFEDSKNSVRGIHDIALENIHIDGNRISQPFVALRDGGKHGISVKGFASNLKFQNITVENCVTDGISIYRGLHTNLTKDNKEIFAAKNVQLKNIISRNNGRHGGSGDSILGFLCEDSKFIGNGQDQSSENGKSISKGLTFNAKKYGNGWDMEGYGTGSAIADIKFANCEFTRNIGAGVVFYDISDFDDSQIQQRNCIEIINCKLDSGTANPTGEFALTFSSTIQNKQKKPLYDHLVIRGNDVQGRLLFRSCDNILLDSNTIISQSPFQLLLDNVGMVSIRSKVVLKAESDRVKMLKYL